MTGTAVKAATVAMAVILIVVGYLACTGSDPSSDPSPTDSTNATSQNIPVSAQECQTSSRENLGAVPIETSLTFAAQWPWEGPDALIKIIWDVPDTVDLDGLVEITGKRVGGNEKAEFLFFDGHWIRRTNLVVPQGMRQGMRQGAYIIFPAPGCWEFQVKADGELLNTITTFAVHDGPDPLRWLPPAASEHGEPPPEIPPSLLQATCPPGNGVIQVQESGNQHSLQIDLSSSSDGQPGPVSVGWLGPDNHFPVSWTTTEEGPLEVSATNLVSHSPGWFSVWDRDRPNFLRYQSELTLPVELQQVDGDDIFWRGRILFPEPGCWLITVRIAGIERELTIWVEPESGRAG